MINWSIWTILGLFLKSCLIVILTGFVAIMAITVIVIIAVLLKSIIEPCKTEKKEEK